MFVASAIHRLFDGQALSSDEAFAAATELMAGDVAPAQAAALLTALRMKGESADEILGFARALRETMNRVRVTCDSPVDTCGTGGDGRGTFNVSTVAAFVAAGAGCRVAKHGNRRVSSRCGSADLLEALSVAIDISANRAAQILETVGLTFLFAPQYHPAMRQLEPVRRQLGFRTIFNLIGPLANPASVRRQVIGVFDRAFLRPVAEVLRQLGAEHALVVHGDDGADEITTGGATYVCELKNGAISEDSLCPEDFGVPRSDESEVTGGTAAENAAIALHVLRGTRSAARDIVILNAGAAIYVAGVAESLADGVRRAAQSIDDGSALERLELLRRHGGPSA